MQPSPIAETSKLLFPSLRFCIVPPAAPHVGATDEAEKLRLASTMRKCSPITLRAFAYFEGAAPYDFQGGWPRLNSEKRLWVAHPCGFCISAPSRCSCGMNGGVFLLSLFLISNFYFLVGRWLGGCACDEVRAGQAGPFQTIPRLLRGRSEASFRRGALGLCRRP